MTMTEAYSPIINLLRTRRKEKHITQEEIADLIGVSKHAYRQFESGESGPSVDMITKVASVLGLKISANVLLPNHPENFEVCSLPADIKEGDRLYKWTVLGAARMDKFRHAHILCECDCHTVSYVELNRIRQGKSTSCGCDRKEKIAKAAEAKAADNPPGPKDDLRGQIFGNLLVLNDPPRKVNDKWEWHCRCLIDNNEKWFRGTKLKSGEVSSCGCQRGKVRKAPNLAGKQFGFLRVGKMQKIEKNRLLVRCRCAVCGKYKYVRPEDLLNHTVISCTCAPNSLGGIRLGDYIVLNENRKHDGFPEVLCWDTAKNENCWIRKETAMRMLAQKLREERAKPISNELE